VRVYFQDPTIIRLNFELQDEDGWSIDANYVDLGSQHVVVFYDEIFGDSGIESFDIAHFGRLLRWHPEFAPKGANANFIEVREDGEERYLRIRTYERGVEGETLACGTGCMSSAIVARLTEQILKMPIRLLTQSGEFVTVNFKLTGDKLGNEHVSNLSLEGNVIRGEEGMLMFDEQTGMVHIEYV
jgi:diaminopimelate epimerase